MENLMIFESFVKSLNQDKMGDFENILADFISAAKQNEIFLIADNDGDIQEFGRKSESPYGNDKIVKIQIRKPHILRINLEGKDKNFKSFRNTDYMRQELERKYPNLDVIMGGNLNSRDYEMGIGSSIEIRPKKANL
jgi:hypothetical protein